MNENELRAVVLDVLGQIAPEADLGDLDPSGQLQEELDLDSINFLDFVSGLHDRTGVDIPERAYPEVATLTGCVQYLHAHAA
ncbi:MAG TPA: acyl carrier protein [Acidimicrobiales bacterium]|nr:acyl carrier protein [Acidimicrobiales bacterium]